MTAPPVREMRIEPQEVRSRRSSIFEAKTSTSDTPIGAEDEELKLIGTLRRRGSGIE